MDNIQKLILGVLGIAGMLVMLVPSQVNVSPGRPSAVPAIGSPVAPPVPANSAAQGDQEEAVEESDFADEDVFLTGEPVIDGNPMQGQPYNPGNIPQQPADQYSAPQSFDYSRPPPISGFANPPAGPSSVVPGDQDVEQGF